MAGALSAHNRVLGSQSPVVLRKNHAELLPDRSQISTASVLIEKPIQKAKPKNCGGVRCVDALVAKNMAITGRVVAMPRRIAIARVSQRRFSRSSPRREYPRARKSE